MSWEITFDLPVEEFDVEAVNKALAEALKEYPGAHVDDEDDEWAEPDAEWADPDEFDTFSKDGGRITILLPYHVVANHPDCDAEVADDDGVPVEIEFSAADDVHPNATIRVQSNASANREAWAIVAEMAEAVALAFGGAVRREP